MTRWQGWREVVLVDFEFEVRPGERPVPVCLVAHEFRSGRRFRLLAQQLGSEPPYAHGPGVLFVAYYASAELGCYRALGWPMPENILDLFCEFRCRTNGLPTTSGSSVASGRDCASAVFAPNVRTINPHSSRNTMFTSTLLKTAVGCRAELSQDHH